MTGVDAMQSETDPMRSEASIVDEFHKLYYNASLLADGILDMNGRTWANTFWLGYRTWKCPLDLWVYQEIIYEVRPDVIVETGTAFGGSALFMAQICELVGNGRVITIDVEEKTGRPKHERVEYLIGSSIADAVVGRVREAVRGAASVMVVLDSDHRKDHVLSELLIYSDLVTVGSYLITEDTSVNGHPILPNFRPGPMEAVEEFLKGNSRFAVDRSREKFYLTFNPGGYLRRIR